MSERPWSSVVLLAAVIAAPVGTALFRVWVYQDSVQVGYRLSDREEERRRLRNELRQLEVELAAERSPARLGELARTLDLEAPAPQQIVGGTRPSRRAHRDDTPVATTEPRATSGSPSALREALARPAAEGKPHGAKTRTPDATRKAARSRPTALEAARALAGAVAAGGGPDGRP